VRLPRAGCERAVVTRVIEADTRERDPMPRRILHNAPEALAEYQIAGLAFLQDVVVFIRRRTRPDDDPS
jgi:hypothetical protein